MRHSAKDRRRAVTLEQYLRGQTREWPRWFGLLLAYREAHGDCRVPYKHKTAERLALGVQAQS